MTKKSFISILLLLIPVTILSASQYNYSFTLYDLILLGVGARPTSLGFTFTAVADDINTVYFNPAGLSQIQNVQISEVYNNLPRFDTQTNFISYTQPIGKGKTFSLSYLDSRTDEVFLTDFEGNILNIVSYKETAYIIASGVKLNKKLSIGATYKYFTQSFEGGSGKGNSIDLGLLYSINNKLRVGLNWQNLKKLKIKSNTGNIDIFSYSIRIGVSYKLLNDKLIILTDYVNPKNDDNELHLGIEYKLLNYLTVRVGSNNGKLTSGIGLNLSNITIDYAYYKTYHTEDTQRISIIYTHKE